MTLHTLGYYAGLLAQRGLLIQTPAGADLTRPVLLVTCDSRSVAPDTLFLCKGAHFRPSYLDQAVQRGAFCYVSETPYPQCPLPCLPVTDVRRAMALLANAFYNEPWRDLRVVGITGTKGKSSTAYFLKSVLDLYLAQKGGQESGLISSIDTYDGAERFESHLTTPEPLDVERHFANALACGLEFLTMEVSSQALKYDRVYGVEFAAAVFLNIGSDHISPVEHPNFEDYLRSKLRIFSQCAAACVNLDSACSERILLAARSGSAQRILTFSQTDPEADIYASNVHKQGGETVFRVRTPRYERELRLTIPGLFNVENALAAAAVCECFGISPACVEAGLFRARAPGRMEVFTSAGREIVAIVDYAHNKLSFEALFRSVREEYPGRQVSIVFGSAGKKAYDRRRDLGETAGRCADRVYVTEEDPGEEDVEQICREIAAYVNVQGCPCSILPDRGEAIRTAIFSCRTPAVVLVTGKGAETRQKRGTAYVDCPSDIDYVTQALREYDAAREKEA